MISFRGALIDVSAKKEPLPRTRRKTRIYRPELRALQRWLRFQNVYKCFLGYLNLINIIFDNGNELFSGWPAWHVSYNKITGCWAYIESAQFEFSSCSSQIPSDQLPTHQVVKGIHRFSPALSDFRFDHPRMVHSLECPCRHSIFCQRRWNNQRSYGCFIAYTFLYIPMNSSGRLVWFIVYP